MSKEENKSISGCLECPFFKFEFVTIDNVTYSGYKCNHIYMKKPKNAFGYHVSTNDILKQHPVVELFMEHCPIQTSNNYFRLQRGEPATMYGMLILFFKEMDYPDEYNIIIVVDRGTSDSIYKSITIYTKQEIIDSTAIKFI